MKLKTNFIRNGNAVLKQVKLPEKNEKLAELVGIILGDGNIHEYKKGKKAGTYMIRIAGDYRKEYDYFHNYVGVLFKDLFEVEPKFHKKKNSNTYYIIVHSKLIVDYFKEMGLKPGNKIKNQSTILDWIWEEDKFLKACVRGLIDTDGSIYEFKTHWPGIYQLTFENRNISLLKDLRKAFIELDYKISRICGNRTKDGTKIYLTRKDQIEKYLKEIGFSNTKHTIRIAP